ncbi:outer membrane protein assembly factor BamC [Kistimonas asteriae]|uniref:outer membrane protein assembly factor BamC n=1 Tax=Kistimonas asteriae TaxID=517724 RepID=UPI001BA98535|nr:outer membrane protein assembly factor BamC [Kistimonas asteriae]
MHSVRMLPLVAAVSLVLGGCSYLTGKDGYFRDKSEDYAAEKTYGRLTLPEGLNPREMPEYLRVPEQVAESGKVGGEVPRPDQRIMRTADEGYSVQRSGDQRWLLAEKSPEKIWPQLVRFWDVSNIPLSTSDAKQGVMETQWIVMRDETSKDLVRRLFGRVVGMDSTEPQEDRFRLTVRQGVRAGTSEIRLQHANRALGSEDKAVWRDGESESGKNTSLEAGLLNEMLVFLVQNADDQSVSLVAQNLSIGDQSALIYDGNGNPVLKISQPFARSWQAVSVALSEAKISVTDQNRSAGIFYIELGEHKADKDDQKGFFGGLFGGSADDSEDEETPKTAYRVRISPLGDEVQVTLEKDLNTLPPVDVSEKVLQSIKSHLS